MFKVNNKDTRMTIAGWVYEEIRNKIFSRYDPLTRGFLEKTCPK